MYTVNQADHSISESIMNESVRNVGNVSKQFTENVSTAISNTVLSNVTFEIPLSSSIEKFKRYECIAGFFAIHSSVFREMLFGSMSQSKKLSSNEDNSVIKLNDTDCQTFEFFRNYFYGLNPPLPRNNSSATLEIGYAVNILYFADKYMINEIKDAMIEHIIRKYINNCKIYNDNYNTKISHCLYLFQFLYYRSLLSMIETVFMPKLRSIFIGSGGRTNINPKLYPALIENDGFYSLPLKLFEIFMFEKNLNIVRSHLDKNHNNTDDSIQDILWDMCIKWAKNKIQTCEKLGKHVYVLYELWVVSCSFCVTLFFLLIVLFYC